ncbi:MAG: VOC family protein [Candidatus Tectomicrobia bacterium]|nr:VOC family protein [Candidatus Tectomicrobia bacterium]
MRIVGGYHHVHLTSPDPEAAAAWYVRMLGAEIYADAPLRGSRNLRLKVGEALLYIRAPRATDAPRPAGGQRFFGMDHVCFAVEGTEEMLAHVVKNGGVIADPLFDLPGGSRGAYLQAPDGVLVELFEPKKD